MSRPAKRKDIADFFRPHVKTTPKKRATPEPDRSEDEDTVVVDLGQNVPQTPSKSEKTRNEPSTPHGFLSKQTADRPLNTPRSDRNLSIPIRSPATTSTIKHLRQPAIGSSLPKVAPEDDRPRPTILLSQSMRPDRDMPKQHEVMEIADSDDDDNESLASLDDILDKPKSRKISGKQAEARQENERLNLLSRFTGGRSNPILQKEKMRDLQRREQENRLRMNAILQEDMMEERTRLAFAKVNAELESVTKVTAEEESADLDKQRLAAILQGTTQHEVEPEDFDRLMGAVERTEAFSTQRTFSFFRRPGQRRASAWGYTPKTFPPSAIPGDLWPPNDIAARDRAYLSGFLTELAACGKLDDRILRWTFDSIMTEVRDHLRHTYTDCVLAASPSWTRTAVTPGDIQAIFQRLDADPQNISDAKSIEVRAYIHPPRHTRPVTDLCVALNLLTGLCQDLDFACLSLLTSISVRLTLDQGLMGNSEVCQKVENLLDALLNLDEPVSRQHVHDSIITDLTKNLSQADLEAQFLKHFVPTTPSTADLHRRLSHTFLFGHKMAGRIQDAMIAPGNATPLQLIIQSVKSHPLFTSSRSQTKLGSTESYATLTSQTRVLDAAISNGLLISPICRQDEQSFNSDIDMLAEHIHSLFVNIADSGASHLRRTEAKETLQALHYRLLYNVRTRAKRKRHVFDPQSDAMNGKKKVRIREAFDPEAEERSRDLMSNFVQKGIVGVEGAGEAAGSAVIKADSGPGEL